MSQNVGEYLEEQGTSVRNKVHMLFLSCGNQAEAPLKLTSNIHWRWNSAAYNYPEDSYSLFFGKGTSLCCFDFNLPKMFGGLLGGSTCFIFIFL